MRVNHLIIDTNNIQKSIDFYCQLLGFYNTEKFVDTGTGNEGNILTYDTGQGQLQILIVPTDGERLPNPRHIAFEVDEIRFQKIYEKAKTLNIRIRKEPSIDCCEDGIGFLQSKLGHYKIFYVRDPANVNIEIMCSTPVL